MSTFSISAQQNNSCDNAQQIVTVNKKWKSVNIIRKSPATEWITK